MSAQPAGRWRPDIPVPTRPTLFVVTTCAGCDQAVAEVRDRNDRPVQLDLGSDGKARRDSAGEWWAVRIGQAWRVVCPEPGEDPPPSGHRYAQHRCPVLQPEIWIEYRGETTVILGAAEPVLPAGVASRPVGRGKGLDGPVCPERWARDQASPPWSGLCSRTCTRCGRVTARSDGDGTPWCGGAWPTRSLAPKPG